jgi:hypothetical protein
MIEKLRPNVQLHLVKLEPFTEAPDDDPPISRPAITSKLRHLSELSSTIRSVGAQALGGRAVYRTLDCLNSISLVEATN